MARRSSLRIEGINRLIAQIERVSGNVVNEELMDEIGFFLSTSILQRNIKGEDVEGRPFEPYSPKYKLFRMKHNHPANIVNLFFSGSMASALTHTAFRDRVEVYFMPTYGRTPSGKSSNVTNAQKAFFLNEKREFFAVSEEEQIVILRMVQEHLTGLLEG